MSDSNPGLMTIFGEALEQPDPATRAAYLDRACGGDTALRQRVEALLAAHAGAGRFLEPDADAPSEGPTHLPSGATAAFDAEPQPPTDLLTGASHSDPSGDTPATDKVAEPAINTVIAGRYTLVQVIGQGGMGSVFLAEQTEPVKRQVALKLIKAGMDSKAVLARFDAERQALALMDHPNIARVFDGGTTAAGQPFFVMELVNGVPLTDYCDQKRLPVRARLELFVQVCQAVQHAHQKGIIHRDLKPGNVLVTEVDGRPTPKVIDFGVAKATEIRLTDLSYADTGAIVGTPAYMSPEQADPSSMDIDTRTDVYALGVMLYELLVGSPPLDARQFKRGAMLEMLRMVREVDPPRPSTKLSAADDLPNIAANRDIEPARLAKSLRGELDWVVMKALEKDRTRRYDTANAFAHDLQRYLADEVVEARPPSAGYRLKKFVRRHKGQVIAVSLVLLALVGGIVGTTLGLFEARRQEAEARKQEKIARAETAEKEKARQAEALRVKERDDALGKRDAALGEAKKFNGDLNKANDHLNHRLGVSAMVLANAAYDNRDFKLVAERLDHVPVEQRGWEWHYLKRQLHGSIFTLYGHRCAVTSVAFSPDGTRIVTGAGNQNVPFEAKVWDARTGMHLFDLKGLAPSVRGWGNIPDVSVAFSADSKRIVTAGGDKTARVYDALAGALQLELKEHAGDVSCAAFSPDGTQIATAFRAGSAAIVKLWDARTGKALLDWKAHRYYVTRLAFSPDGTRILTGGSDRAVKVWDAQTGELVLEVKGMMNSDESSGLAFSPDGKRIVAGREDDTARVIDARTGGLLLELKGRPRVSHAISSTSTGVLTAAFSPDGARIATGGTTGGFGTGEASVWDARTGAELLELKGLTSFVMSVAFSPDGERIITGGADGTAKVWDARTGTPRLELEGIKGSIACASFSPDGMWMVTGGGDGTTKLWDARTGIPKFALKGLEGRVNSVAVSSDGTRIVTGGGKLQEPGQARMFGEGTIDIGGGKPEPPVPGKATVWDTRTGLALVELVGLKEPVNSVAFSPSGTHIVTAGARWWNSGGTELKVWDATTGTVLFDLSQKDQRATHAGERGGSVAFSRDGRRFVTGGMHNVNSLGTELKVWDATTAAVKVEMKENKSPVLSVAFSPDGTRIATGNYSKTATIWDAETGTALLELKGHTGNVNSVGFSPDGKRIVTGSDDRTVRVWDARTGTTLAELKGHTGAVTSVSFSADGARLLAAGGTAAGKPGEVFVWDAPKATEVELVGHTGFIQAVAFSPDGTRIATASQDKTVKVWDATTGTEIAELKTGSLKSVAFGIDGTRIVSQSHDRITKVWDAHTGQELKGEAIPKTVSSERTSQGGRLFALLNKDRVEVVRLVPDEEESAYRRLHTQPNPSRYRAGYLAARAAKDAFAAAFYLDLIPLDERKGLLAQADAEAFAALTKLAAEHQRAGKLAEAVPLLVEILSVNKAKLGPDAPATIEAADTLGRIHYQAGQFEKAVPLLEDVLNYRKAKLGREDRQTLNAMGMLGLAYKDVGRLPEAIAVLEEGAAKDAWVMQNLLDVYALAGVHAKVIDLSLKQLAEVRKSRPEDTYTPADLLARLGRAYLAEKKWSDAEPHLRECVTIRAKNRPDDWTTFDAQALLGASLLGQKKYAEAEPLLLKGYEGLKEREKSLEPRDARRVLEAIDQLIELYTATNKPDEAKKWQAERAKFPSEKK
jgi:eukaryotic-like serine/threonine-protein kinase